MTIDLVLAAISDFKKRVGDGFTHPTHGRVEGAHVVLLDGKHELARYRLTSAGDVAFCWMTYARDSWRVTVRPKKKGTSSRRS